MRTRLSARVALLILSIITVVSVLAAAVNAAEIDESSMRAWSAPGTYPNNMRLVFEFQVIESPQGVLCSHYSFTIHYRLYGTSTWSEALCLDPLPTNPEDDCWCYGYQNPVTYRTSVVVSIDDPCTVRKYEWKAVSEWDSGNWTSVKTFKAQCIN